MADLLKTISALAEHQLDVEHQIRDLEEQLKEARKKHQRVSESDLPEAMDAADMLEFKLKDGRKITIAQKYHVSLPKDPDRREVALTFLRENGYASVIKRLISVAFGAGEDRNARNFLRRLQRSKTLVDNEIRDDENVHPSTLKALMKEMKEEGYDVPDEAFGLYIRRIAEIR